MEIVVYILDVMEIAVYTSNGMEIAVYTSDVMEIVVYTSDVMEIAVYMSDETVSRALVLTEFSGLGNSIRNIVSQLDKKKNAYKFHFE